MSYGYDSTVAFSTAVSGINDFALGLINGILLERNTRQEKSRPIIFVCHSLGGIVVKKAFILAHSRPSVYSGFLRNVKGVVFMGTPHRGCGAAYWADFFFRALSVAQLGLRGNNDLLSDLKQNSRTLSDILLQFLEIGASLPIRTFYETRALGTTMVVNDTSARLDWPNEIALPIDANHKSMCKFPTADCQIYRPVWRALRDLVNDALLTTPPPSLSIDENDYISRFKVPDYDDYYVSIRDLHVDGTCTWFLENPKYNSWLDATSSSLLWVSADPGCGKSVLCSYLVDELQKVHRRASPPSTLCFFFFKNGSTNQGSAVDLLCGILYQVFSAKPELIKHAKDPLKDNRSAKEFGTLWRILMAILDDPSAGNIMCIIDALDECEDDTRGRLINYLARLYPKAETRRSNRAVFKLLVTSRPDRYIEDGFHGLQVIRLKVEDELNMTSADIAFVVKARLKDLGSKVGWSLSSLEQHLIDNADRTFLWVKLVLEMLELESEVSEEAFNNVVRTLPSGLDCIYDKILKKATCNATQDKTKKMLQIIITASRPLTIKELGVAYQIRSTDKSIQDLEVHIKKFNVEKTVKSLCGSFVRVIGGKVYLVHLTAKEFLLKAVDFLNTEGTSWKHCLDPVESSMILARICIWYLQLSDFEDSALVIDGEGRDDRHLQCRLFTQRYDFLSYAAGHWAAHFREAGSLADSGLSHAVLKLCDTRRRRSQMWFQLYWVLTSQLGDCPSEFTPFMVASYFGHLSHVQLLFQKALEDDLDIDFGDRYSRTPLYWAAGHGHVEVCRFLISKGACATAENNWDSSTPLSKAAEIGNTAIVCLMIENGVDVEAYAEGTGETALHFAARGKFEELAYVLLENGADVDSRENSSDTPLHYSAQSGSEAVTRILMEHGAELSTFGFQGRTALHNAVEGGHRTIVQLLIDNGAELNAQMEPETMDFAEVEFSGFSHGTPLHAAVKEGNMDMLLLLLENGADITVKDPWGATLLDEAASSDQQDIVKLLLDRDLRASIDTERYNSALQAAAYGGSEILFAKFIDLGADINAAGGKYGTALEAAASGRNESIIQRLLDLNPNVNIIGNRYGSALQAFANIGDIAIPAVTKLLESGARLNTSGKYGCALQVACASSSVSVVLLLCNHGANPNILGGKHGSPLIAAASHGNQEIVEILLKHGADVNLTGEKYCSALHAAAYGGHKTVVQTLLKEGAQIQAECGDYGNALNAAASGGKVAVITMLLAHGADINASGGTYKTALLTAILCAQGEAAALLLDRGADVNAVRGEYGCALEAALHWGRWQLVGKILRRGSTFNPVHAEAKRGNELSVRVLIQEGVDFDISDGYGWTALHYASLAGHARTVRLLLRSGCKAEVKNPCGQAALHLTRSRPIAKMLLASGADTEDRDQFSRTPLQIAAFTGSRDVVSLLLEMRADLHGKDLYGRTSLHMAAAKGHEDIVEMLLGRGADFASRDLFGRIALDYAYGQENVLVVRMLESRV